MHQFLTLRWLVGLLVALGLGFACVQPVAAQGELVWRERATNYFSILHTPDDTAMAEEYALWVDEIYDDLATFFAHRTATPLSLRLFPTSESYYQANPAARNVPGVVAHADFRRRELVVIIERTAAQSAEEVRNNVRHELTHIIAADLSGNRLNTGFHEGIAQYMERPTETLEYNVAALRQISAQGQLLPWSAFDNREQIYGQPELSYPQTLAVVAFLVDRDGFARLREFLRTTATSSGYRSALESTYGVAPTVLESEWLAWLPSYLEGGYRRSAVAVYDLSLAHELVAGGNYAAAAEELRSALTWMERQGATQPAAVVAEAKTLLERSEQGMRAEQLAERAREALVQTDYVRAAQLIADAQQLYGSVGDERQATVLAIYAERAARGHAATARLSEADALARAWRYPQARAAADSAAAEFAALGDTLRHSNAVSLRTGLDVRQRLAGLFLIAIGAAGMAFSLLGRLFAGPSEVW